MYGDTLDFQCQHQNGYIKYPIWESIFAVNLLLKLFPATVANADIVSLKSLYTLFDKYLDHMLVKFEQNCMVQTTQNFELFDKESGFKNIHCKNSGVKFNTPGVVRGPHQVGVNFNTSRC